MSVARRFLITASAAGSLLAALWFVPSATATSDLEERQVQQAQQAQQARQAIHGQAEAVGGTAADTAQADAPRLADTGSVDTTPYLIGGTVSLGVGACFVAHSVRRRRPTGVAV